MAKHVVADLEVLFTANTQDVDKAEKQVIAVGKKIESNPVKVKGDPKPVLDDMDRVERAAKKLVSERAVVKLDADITRAESGIERTKNRLEDLRIRAEGGLDVTADVRRAEASLQRFERQLDGLKQARSKVDIEVNEAPAEAGLKRFLSLFKKKTEETGSEGGRSLSQGLDAATRGAGEKVGAVVGGEIESTLVDALSAIPIAGGIILAGVAIGKAIKGAIDDGLAVEKRTDNLQALTGISEADALRISRAAGEAYANNFGESIESNMDATRLALQFRILDPSATTRDAQLVVQGLAGISDVLEEDVRPTAQAVAQLLSTGLAKNAQHAYDLIATGARNGLNRNEDLLDTLTEYPALFQRLGLSGEEALGLINQGMRAGARNSDLAADALKEFQIRATDASVASATGFEQLGLNAEEMTAKIARGGQEARDGLDLVLDRLRETEDPVLRNAAAVALFGTQAEDLGEALFSMDLSTAVEQLGGVTGAAQKMFDTLAGNDASKIEQAQRNIEVAADGIKGALAGAFAEPLGDFADWVSQNRGPVLQFFSDLVNGAIDFGITATESFGSFVSGPLADIVEGLKHIIKVMNPFADTSDLEGFINGMRDFEGTTDDVADKLEGMRDKFNGFAEGQIALGYVNDAALRTADAVSKVGFAADTGAALLSEFSTQQDGSVRASGDLQRQLEASAQALRDEYDAATEAGESQENLRGRYDATVTALMGQLTAMGLTQEQAQALIDTVLQTPEEASTYYASNAESEQQKIENLANRIVTLPDGSTVIYADATPATWTVDKLIETSSGKKITLKVFADGSGFKLPGGQVVTAQARGSVLEFMADGGLPGLTPMSSLAQMVPASTWRVVGDRSDVPELFAPLDGSARSWALLLEGLRRMPGSPFGSSSTPDSTGGGGGQSIVVNQDVTIQHPDATLAARQLGRGITEAVRSI
ncbi:Phage-related minor tail protein [Microbacterium hydrocarbonoxydans]|uniref:Phage-related minor tail protein n=1 Tax=Microbacterium hydrocarbonoxydans TaxID=273678 RepID=A0A0M2HXI0_9MICO|nr:phage tail tape measure protein [Microbacterium hydrocarbonoxydans]KJL49143.1 Phage-related minor tail protein [Microbacterium hydrocarbonoxydans]